MGRPQDSEGYSILFLADWVKVIYWTKKMLKLSLWQLTNDSTLLHSLNKGILAHSAFRTAVPFLYYF